MRWNQVKGCMDELFANENHAGCVLWQDELHHLLSDPVAAEFQHRQNPSASYWNFVKQGNHPFVEKGKKTLMSEFLGVIRSLRRELQHFHLRSFFYQMTALELVSMGNAKFASLVKAGASIASGLGLREDSDQNQHRKACANQLVVAVMSVLQEGTHAIDNMIVEGSTPWDEFY